MVRVETVGVALAGIAVVIAAVAAIRSRPVDRVAAWRWAPWLLAGAAVVAATVLGPLDVLGREGNLTAHVAQHLLLADIAAPLLWLGLPPLARNRMRAALARGGAVWGTILSPLGALTLWALGVTAWYLPPLHRLAAPEGIVHALDHVSFLALGLLVWLAVFDVRAPEPNLRRALMRGGLPWWARHLYAVGSRPLMLPAALLVWFAAGYTKSSDSGRQSDQVEAASLLIGFEMFLFVGAVIAGFIALAVNEGRREQPGAPVIGDDPARSGRSPK